MVKAFRFLSHGGVESEFQSTLIKQTSSSGKGGEEEEEKKRC
jgi:hypothetical protein